MDDRKTDLKDILHLYYAPKEAHFAKALPITMHELVGS
jgi:hypothetical protein